MTPDRLLAHFNRITEAPDAIPRLRRFILDLAVRGKLVEQDPNDEPASDLLKRIRAEKARLIKVGEMRQPDLLPAVGESDAPFELPSNWEWTRIGEAFNYDAGKKREPKELVSDRWLLELEDIEKDTSVVLTRLTVGERDSRSTKSEFLVGDILYGKLRPYLNKVVVANEPGYSTTEIVAIRPFIPLCSAYCCLAFRRPDFVAYVNRVGQGTKMPRLRTQDALVAVFPLPPLAEQHRIVAKVDELMALCDRLEAAQAERERRRDRLAAASLHRLNNGADAAEFREHARFHLDHLARFTTRPDQIPALRQTILNLAVRGKLVPQDPNDEPAAELLERIQAERERLISKGEAKEQKQVRSNSEADEEFAIPASWRWVSLGDIAFSFRYGTSTKCSYEPTGVPVLRIPNIDNGRINIEDLKFGPLTEREADDLRLQAGDILMVRSNGSLNLVGRPALVESHAVGYCYAGYLVRVRISSSHLDARYLLLALNTPHARDQIEIPIRTTVGLKNVNATELGNLIVPLPPLAEQHRIVAKVEELLALCDQLEAQLTHTQTERRRLLEATLHEALHPVISEVIEG